MSKEQIPPEEHVKPTGDVETPKSEKIMEITEEDVIKVKDMWDKHNFGTRATLIVFLISFIVVVVASFFGVVTPTAVVNMVFYSIIIAFITVTLGINGVKIILDGIAKIKMGRD